MRFSRFRKRILITATVVVTVLLAVGVSFCLALVSLVNAFTQVMADGLSQAITAYVFAIVCALTLDMLYIIDTFLTMPLQGIQMLLFGTPLLLTKLLQALFEA